MVKIKIEYLVLNEKMTDKEMDDAEFKEIIISEDKLMELLHDELEFNPMKDDYIDQFYVNVEN